MKSNSDADLALKSFLILACLTLVFSDASFLVSGQSKGGSSQSRNNAEWERTARELSAQFPQIRSSDLRLLGKYIYDLTASGIDKAQARRIGMEAMAKGKALLPENEQREMENLNQEILDSYSPETSARIERLRIVVNAGRAMTAADQEFLMTQFKKGFESLPTEDQKRLQNLNGKAIRAFLSTRP